MTITTKEAWMSGCVKVKTEHFQVYSRLNIQKLYVSFHHWQKFEWYKYILRLTAVTKHIPGIYDREHLLKVKKQVNVIQYQQATVILEEWLPNLPKVQTT